MTRMSRARFLAMSAAVILNVSHMTQAGTCTFPSPNSVDCQMTNGARWEFSWQNDAKKGLVLNTVTLTPKLSAPRTLILEQASLAEVLVTYDNTTNPSLNLHHLNTGLPLIALNENVDCPLTTGTSRLNNAGSGPTLLCLKLQPRGYASRGTSQVQGEQLVIFGASAVNGDTYIQQWVFSDDGSIQPMIGVSGQLDTSRDSTATTGWPIGPSGSTRYATNRFHTAYWRLDFALGGQGNDLFQELQTTPLSGGNAYNLVKTDVATENKFTISPDTHRFWLVKDTVISNAANGQKISFEIVPLHTSVHRGTDPLTSADIYVTQGGSNKSCEQFATANPATPGYPDNTPCASSLTQFVNGESITDPVVWVGTTWHQVPRAEDEANVQIHWQGLTLAPRDISSTSPFN